MMAATKARPRRGPITAPAIHALEPPFFFLPVVLVSPGAMRPVETGCGIESAITMLVSAERKSTMWNGERTSSVSSLGDGCRNLAII